MRTLCTLMAAMLCILSPCTASAASAADKADTAPESLRFANIFGDSIQALRKALDRLGKAADKQAQDKAGGPTTE